MIVGDGLYGIKAQSRKHSEVVRGIAPAKGRSPRQKRRATAVWTHLRSSRLGRRPGPQGSGKFVFSALRHNPARCRHNPKPGGLIHSMP